MQNYISSIVVTLLERLITAQVNVQGYFLCANVSSSDALQKNESVLYLEKS